MKKLLALFTILVSQMFFTLENGQCANIKSLEEGKSNLWPAPNNDTK